MTHDQRPGAGKRGILAKISGGGDAGAGVTTRNEVDELIAEMGRAYGAEGLALDSEGECVLLVNGRTNVALHFEEASGRLLLECEVGRLLEPYPQSILEMLAHGNRLSVETLGGTLALGPEGQVMLMRELAHARLTFEALGLALQAQAEGAEIWDRRLGEGPPSADDEQAPIEIPDFIDPTRMA